MNNTKLTPLSRSALDTLSLEMQGTIRELDKNQYISPKVTFESSEVLTIYCSLSVVTVRSASGACSNQHASTCYLPSLQMPLHTVVKDIVGKALID
jgi:hypothetical protein